VEVIVLAIAAVLSLVGIGGWLLYHRATLRPGHEAVEQAAARLNELVTGIDTLRQTVARDVELVRYGFAAEEFPEVLGESEQLLEQAEKLLRTRDELSDLRPKSLWRGDLDTLKSTAERIRRLADTAEEFQKALRSEDVRLGEVLNTASTMPARLARTRELAATAQRAAEVAREAGFDPAEDEVPAGRVEERLESVERLATNKQILAALGELDALEAQLAASDEALRSVHRRTEAAEARISEIETGVAQAPELHREADEAARILAEHHAPTVSEGMADDVAQGRAEFQQVERLADDARQALHGGAVRRAERLLDEAEELRTGAEDRYARPEQRLRHVRELQTALPVRRTALTERLSAVRDRAGQEESAATLAPLAKELRAQVQALDLAADRPHWLLAERRIDDAESLAEGLEAHLDALDSAMGEMRSMLARVHENRSRRIAQQQPTHTQLAELSELASPSGSLHDAVTITRSAVEQHSGAKRPEDEAAALLHHGRALRTVRRFTDAATAQAAARALFVKLDSIPEAAEASAEQGQSVWALERWDEAIAALT
jgi:hypothetical protein